MGPEQLRRIDAATRAASSILSMATVAAAPPRAAELISDIDRLAYIVETDVFEAHQYSVQRGTLRAARRMLYGGKVLEVPFLPPKITAVELLAAIASESTRFEVLAVECAECMAILAKKEERPAYQALAAALHGAQ